MLNEAQKSAEIVDSSSGQRFGRYQLARRIGQGATGRAFLAQDERRGHWVALKPLRLDAMIRGEEHGLARDRFLREAKTFGRLHHPGIVAVFDAGETDGIAWIAMEAVAGTDLTRYTRAPHLLPEPLIAHIGVRVAQALARAHAKGIVHRDVKPANILMDFANDVIKLADFGIARLGEHSQTRTGVTLGSPEYMAPEQLSGAEVGPPVDIYALGATIFELLSGRRRPQEAATLGELLRAATVEAPVQLFALRPDLPSAMCELVMRALAQRPAQRPAASSWAEQLSVWAPASPGLAVVPL